MLTLPLLYKERFFDDFFDDTKNALKAMPSTNLMKTDIIENENGYELDIELPGYAKEDIKGELKDGYLTVSAAKSESNDKKDDEGKYIRKERYYGSCSRSFYVGDAITEEDIKAKFENGVLKMSIPKKEKEPEVEEKKFISIEG